MEYHPDSPRPASHEALVGAAIVADALGIADHYTLEISGEGDSIEVIVHPDTQCETETTK